MPRADVVIIGAGQAGLAMSRELAALGIDHVLLERGRVAERWRSTSWDSLTLLTPNWMTRLPDWRYRGPDPDGYMGRDGVVRFLAGYAAAISAPVITDAAVVRVETLGEGYVVHSLQGTWQCRGLVIATGHCDLPCIPAVGGELPHSVAQLHSSHYRNPAALPPGEVLVVGASASGVQIAEELARAGRRVTISVGRHTPLPRSWLGKDIFFWLDRMGVLDEPLSETGDAEAARAQPSLQLAGRPDHSNLDLARLDYLGVRLAGRLTGASGRSLQFNDDLAASIASAEAKRDRLLLAVNRYAHMHDRSAELHRLPKPFRPTQPAAGLGFGSIGVVIWATGFRRDFSWLDLPVHTGSGELLQRGGETPLPGVFALGFRFLRRRNSSFIDGVGADAAALAQAMGIHLGVLRRRAA